jgi:very-short-patch-repair endonuclease
MQRKHPILTHDDFITHLDSFPGSRGIRRLRAAFSHARSGTDSVPETILRLTVVEAGFSTPQPNIPVQTGSGMRYVDLGWIDAEIGLEYQGSYHYEAAGQGRADQQRRADLERAGWIIIEVVWEDLQRPYALAERIAAAFSHRLR